MSNRLYSIIIPVYNRPEEIDELLESLCHQTNSNFEVLVVEDGSTQKCEHIVSKYKGQLNIQYFFKENSGQGFSRNFGFRLAKGDFLIVFDSDCIIPSHYFEAIDKAIGKYKWDAFGGPDRAHPQFNDLQKAISYSMTSFFTTGGIRGNEKHIGQFHPRSFNMGISKEVFEKTQGYLITRMGEDIEFSIRIIEEGFKVGLVPEAYVYHKRRTSLSQFYKQLHFFGRARVNVFRFYKKELKLVHLLPGLFVISVLLIFLSPLVNQTTAKFLFSGFLFYYLLIFVDSLYKNKNLKVALLSISTSFVQLFAYGLGFWTEFRRYFFGQTKPSGIGR